MFLFSYCTERKFNRQTINQSVLSFFFLLNFINSNLFLFFSFLLLGTSVCWLSFTDAFDMPFIENNNNVFYLIPNGLLNPMDWLSTPGFKKDLNNLSKKYDFLFFCADNENSIDILRALMSEKFFHITLARIRRTKKDTLTKMQSIAPAQGLLHD